MGAIFEFIANMFGYVLNFIYNIVNNYGLAVIIFTVLLKLIMIPYNVKQQKTMKKTQKVQIQVKEIQEKYSNDPVRQNQEVMDLYKRENVSPMSGCLSTLVTLFIFISIFYLVSRPLTFMRHVDSEKIAEYTKKLTETQVEQKVEEKSEEKVEDNKETSQEQVDEIKQEESQVEETTVENKSEDNKEEVKEENKEVNKEQKQVRYVEIAIIKNFASQDEEVNINMNFLGLDLSDIPVENLTNVTVFIIPALYVLTSIAMMKITKMQTDALKKPEDKKKEENKDKAEDDQQVAMDQMSKTMTYMMPIMSVSISLVAPLGLALYWFVSNVFTIGERLITNKFFKKSEEE